MIRELGRLSRARMFAAARAAEHDGRGMSLLTGAGWEATELAIDPIEEIRVPHGGDALGSVRDGRFIGYLAYEAARGLERPAWVSPDARPAPIGAAMVLRRYGAIARRDEQTGVVAIEGDDAAAIAALSSYLRIEHPPVQPAALALSPVDDDAVHAARVATALELIARGDIYVVNLARTFAGVTSARSTEILATLLQRTTARYAAALDLGDHALACSSPELFLDVGAGVVRTSPIKGTRPRGVDAVTDRAQYDELSRDPKEAAELTMIIDLERNDLGRIAEIGSVRVLDAPRIETTRTVHHRVADVVARTGATLPEIVAAMFPSGSVTGAPKVRAMEVIAELERDRRGIYCGAIVRIHPDGRLRAAMAIRTVVVERGRGEAVYHAGGGIVESSDPRREVAETLWKARQVAADGPG